MDLALGLKAAVMLLNPERIVIGGGIAIRRATGFFHTLTRRGAAANHGLVRRTSGYSTFSTPRR